MQETDSKIKDLTPIEMLAIALSSPALTFQASGRLGFDYPENYKGRVPLRVKVLKNVRSDIPFRGSTVFAQADNEYYAWVNSYGAVSAILPNGEKLGLVPVEFNVTGWHGGGNGLHYQILKLQESKKIINQFFHEKIKKLWQKNKFKVAPFVEGADNDVMISILSFHINKDSQIFAEAEIFCNQGFPPAQIEIHMTQKEWEEI